MRVKVLGGPADGAEVETHGLPAWISIRVRHSSGQFYGVRYERCELDDGEPVYVHPDLRIEAIA